MVYNKKEFPNLMQTAGKITILTALAGVVVFLVAFMFDVGTAKLTEVSAQQTASTTLTVLNTPPQFTVNAFELTDSSTSSPTNSGSVMQWRAVGVDTNGAPYFLLICSTNASPTAVAASSTNNLGTRPPICGGGGIRWGVSAAASSGVPAIVSTTTSEVGSFATGAFSGEKHNWYAWVCDDDPFNPRCNNVPVQGPTSTVASSSPYHINKRPVISAFSSNQPVDPGATLTFSSVSTDPDSVGGEDNIYLVVCQTNGGFNVTTRICTSDPLASTTGAFTANATAPYILAPIVRDNTYPSYGYLVDQHGHTATSTPAAGPSLFLHNFVVNNVAPTLLGGDILLNDASTTPDFYLTEPGDETTGFTLDFTVRDANSCINSGSTPEITDYDVTVYRTSLGTTTCSALAATYNPNECYTSGVATTTWNLSCTVAGGSCIGATDDTVVYNCTFPLWFVADPTDNGVNTPAALEADTWSAAVSATDDDGAFSPLVATNFVAEMYSFTALDLLSAQIPYGALEPGANSGTLSATTTVQSVGNTGLDQEVEGESMCTTFSIGNECAASITSTVPENQQKFSSTSLSYASLLAETLSSTTPNEVELDVPKTTATSSPQVGDTYWGIAVPISITLAGSYRGLNTFFGVTAEANDWLWVE
jgi:hypothetical protein